MKKLWLTGLLAVLGISAVYGWRHRHATRVEFSGTAANATAEAGEATSTVTALSRANSTTAAVSRATGYLASGAKQDVIAARQYKREWDYNYFSSLTNASPGSPIRFVLTDGVFATGAIHHLEHTHGELLYVSGELTSPEPGRFFFQKQTLSGKQGDFAGVVEFPGSKTAWRICNAWNFLSAVGLCFTDTFTDSCFAYYGQSKVLHNETGHGTLPPVSEQC